MTGRPEILWPLFGALERLDGIGPKSALALTAAHIEKPRDLLFTLPHSGVDRQRRDTIMEVQVPAVCTVEVTVGAHNAPAQRGRPYRVIVEDAETTFQLVFFRAHGEYLRKQLPTGQRRVVSGKVEMFDAIAQMVHPDHILTPEDGAQIPPFEPVYPLTGTLTQKAMFKATADVLSDLPDLEEWIDPALRARENWPDWNAALMQAHRPACSADLAPTAKARQRLAYDEVLAHQLTLALARANARRGKGRATAGDG